MTITGETPRELDAVIVGAGFSGLYALMRLRRLGLAARVLEQGDGVGGTWYWNRYPGARCDIESIDYSYSFDEQLVHDWDWSERYPAQPEILRYLEHVADRFDLRRDIQLGTRVTTAAWDEDARRWRLETAAGERVCARFCVMATGNLTSLKQPDVPGLETFAGEWVHTARWPREGVELEGRRVGVIGTGSTGIQVVTTIAPAVEQLLVFQRTPNYSMPARNHPLDAETLQALKDGFAERRALARASEGGVSTPPPQRAATEVGEQERHAAFAAGWQRGGLNALSAAFTDFHTDEAANAAAQEFAREQIRAVVRDPATAAALCPEHHIGTRRTCVDTGYYETFNRDNVALVDVRADPIAQVEPEGVRLRSGALHELDVLVLATGFDAITGALREIDIAGVGGRTLREAWAEGPRTLLGLAVAGFPNLFVVTGPGSPSVLSNMVVSIEQHVDWIADAVAHMQARGLDRIEASPEAEAAWAEHVAELAAPTLYPQARSWYLGANIPGKPRVFMPYVAGCAEFRRECDAVAERGYEGFALDGPGGRPRGLASEHEEVRA